MVDLDPTERLEPTPGPMGAPLSGNALASLEWAIHSLPWVVRLGWLSLLVHVMIVLLGYFLLTGQWEAIAYALQTTVFNAAGNGGSVSLMTAVISLDPAPVAARLGLFGSLLFVLLNVIASFALLPVVVLILQVSSGQKKPPSGFLYFRFGERETKSAVAQIVLFLTVYLISFLISVLFAGGYVIGSLTGVSLPPLVTVPVSIVLLIAMMWVVGRTCLLMPGIALRNDLDILGPLRVTKGFAWSLIASLLLLIVLTMFIVLGLMAVIWLVTMVLTVGQSSNILFPVTQQSPFMWIVVFAAIQSLTQLVASVAFIAWQGKAWAALAPVEVSNDRR